MRQQRIAGNVLTQEVAVTVREHTTASACMTGYEGRYREEDGYTIAFEKFEDGGDFTPFYKGLPDDRCQSHHWGYVVKGRLIMHMPAGDEIIEAGEAYYTPPGHTDELDPGTVLVEFSPTELDAGGLIINR